MSEEYFYVKAAGKLHKILKKNVTSKGDEYWVPVPEIQAKLDLNMHQSFHKSGSIHLRNDTYPNIFIKKNPFQILADILDKIKEKSSISEISDDATGIVIKKVKLLELFKQSQTKEEGADVLDIAHFASEIQKRCITLHELLSRKYKKRKIFFAMDKQYLYNLDKEEVYKINRKYFQILFYVGREDELKPIANFPRTNKYITSIAGIQKFDSELNTQ